MTYEDFRVYKKYFNPKEFDSPDKPYSGLNMKKDFMNLLYVAREEAGVPFRITSGYRTVVHNRKVGGVANSSHLFGEAVDIKTKDNYERFQIVSSLIMAGFKRIGIGKNFVHVDCTELKAQRRIWMYGG